MDAIPSRGATRARRARSARGKGSSPARERIPFPATTREAPPAPTRAPRTSRRGAEAERRRRPGECAIYPSIRGRAVIAQREALERPTRIEIGDRGGVGRARERRFRSEPFRFRGARVPFDAPINNEAISSSTAAAACEM